MSNLTLEEIREKIKLLENAQFEGITGLTSVKEIPILEIALLKSIIKLYEDNWPDEVVTKCDNFEWIVGQYYLTACEGRAVVCLDINGKCQLMPGKDTIDGNQILYYKKNGIVIGEDKIWNIIDIAFKLPDGTFLSETEFNEYKEKMPKFKIIDERHFSYGDRKFILDDAVTKMQIIQDELLLEKGDRRKNGYSQFTMRSLETSCIISNWFTEVTEESAVKQPVTDCDQLDGWIEHKGTTNRCPVEEGTLLLVETRDKFQYYFNAENFPLWKNQRKDKLFLADIMAYKIIAPASEKWIAWNGGKCPVGEGTPVYFRLKNGLVFPPSPAGILPWEHACNDHDIIAYRVVEEEKEEESNLSFYTAEKFSKDINRILKINDKKAQYERIKAKFEEIDNKGFYHRISETGMSLNYDNVLVGMQKKLDYLVEELFGEEK